MEEKKTLKEKISEKVDEAKFKIKVRFDNTWEWIGQHKVELIIVTPIVVKVLDTIGRGISASSRNNYAKAKYRNDDYKYYLKGTLDGVSYNYCLKRKPTTKEIEKLKTFISAGYSLEEALDFLDLM